MHNPKPMLGDFIGPWRPWFAWFPVTTYDGEWLWLRRVDRRRVQKHEYLSGPSWQWWMYSRHLECAAPEKVG